MVNYLNIVMVLFIKISGVDSLLWYHIRYRMLLGYMTFHSYSITLIYCAIIKSGYPRKHNHQGEDINKIHFSIIFLLHLPRKHNNVAYL